VSPDQLPLRTSSRWIVDKNGHRVKWSCVNWSGAAEKDGVPGGLQHAFVRDIAQLIAEWGFNCVRIPWSVWMVHSNHVISDAALLSANMELVGKTTLSILDVVVSACVDERLMVVLDNHMSDGDWCCSETDENGLWYNTRWSESQWIDSHVTLAKRYQNQPYVVGVELRNELRGATVNGTLVKPMWGTGGDKADWRAAALRAGDALLAVRPEGLLIIVDGPDYSTDFTGVVQHPIKLSVPHRLVYSTHDYSWSQPSMTKEQLHAHLDSRWGYLLEEGKPYTAPIWVSEFGEYHDGRNFKHGWWPDFLAYMEAKDVDFAYWRCDGTESRGTSRVFGDEAGFGIMNMSWNGAANGGILLQALQLLQGATLGPHVDSLRSGNIVVNEAHVERFGHHEARPPDMESAAISKG